MKRLDAFRRPMTGIVMVTLAISACRRTSSETSKADAPQDTDTISFSSAQIQHGGVKWARALATDVTPSVEVPAELVPDEDRTARIGAPVESRVIKVHVRVGDHVSKDQALVTLRSSEASTARSDLEKSLAELRSRRASLTYARVARERAERLLEAKAMSRQEVERARTDEETAQSAFRQAESEAERARAGMASIGPAVASGEVTLRSPISGVVLSREAVPGSIVASGTPLVTVTDSQTLWLEVSASERLSGVIYPGLRIGFTVPAFPGKTFEGIVRSVAGALDARTRTLPVQAIVDNRSGGLKPRMFATARIEAGPPTRAVVVPDTAIVLVDEKPVIFVAVPDGSGAARFERREVELGNRFFGRAAVLAGVEDGELVVLEGAFAIKSQFERSKMAGG
ncbi:MAG: efflux RND transporter periplasmic adaptor subunit [Acidobacteriota bacterium]